MKDYAKTSSKNGGPAYRTPASYRNKKEEEIVKTKAHNQYEKVFRRKSFGRRG